MALVKGMAGILPKSPNEYVPLRVVLPYLGYPVNVNVPAVIRCKFCGELQLNVDYDVLRGKEDEKADHRNQDGNYWWYCTSCKFAGDSLEIYKAVRGLSSYTDVVAAMREDGVDLSDIDVADTTLGKRKLDIIADYEQRILMLRTVLRSFWEMSRENLKGPRAAMWGNVLAQWKLDISADPVWITNRSRLVGGISKFDLQSLPCSAARRAAGVQDEEKYLLFIPTWDVPGRINGGHVLTNSAHLFFDFNVRPGALMEYKNSGLAFLQQMHPCQDKIYAVDDMLTALYLHVGYMRDHPYEETTAFPVVSYTPGVYGSWRALERFGKEIVLWQRGGWNPDMLLAANRCTAARLAPYPRWSKADKPDALKVYLQVSVERRPHEVLATMRDSAESFPYVEALKTYLLNAPPETRLALATQLQADGFSEERRQQLLAACPEARRSMLAPYFQEKKSHKTAQLGGSKFMLSDGFLLSKGRGAKVVSTVIVEIYSRTYYVDLEDAWYSGQLLYGDHSVPFSEAQSVLERDLKGWIERKLMAAGIAPGFIDTGISSRTLLAVFTELSQPHFARSTSRVGWDSQLNCFAFPHFHVIDAKVEKLEVVPPARISCPAKNLVPPLGVSPELVARMIGRDDTLRGFWALFSVLMFNFLASRHEYVPTPIGVVAEMDRHPLLQWYIDSFGLLMQPVGAKHGVDELQEAAASHDLATVIRIDGDAGLVMRWLCEGESANVVTGITEMVGKLLLLNNSVSIVTPPCPLLEPSRLYQAERLFSGYLCWLQRFSKRPPYERMSLVQVAASIDQWLSEYSGVTTDLVGMSVCSHVKAPESRGHYGPRLVEVVEYLLQRGVISEAVMRTEQAAVIKGEDAVTIRYPRLDRVLRSLGFPPLPRATINAMLVEESAYLGGDASSCTMPLALYNRWKVA